MAAVVPAADSDDDYGGSGQPLSPRAAAVPQLARLHAAVAPVFERLLVEAFEEAYDYVVEDKPPWPDAVALLKALKKHFQGLEVGGVVVGLLWGCGGFVVGLGC